MSETNDSDDEALVKLQTADIQEESTATIPIKAECNIAALDNQQDPLKPRIEINNTDADCDNINIGNFDFLFDETNLNVHVKKPIRKCQSKRGARQANEYISSSGINWTEAATKEDLPKPKFIPHGKGPANSITTLLEAWTLLIDNEILEILLEHTNAKIRKQREKHQRPTDLNELRAWLGLCYLCGVFRNATHNGPLQELWTIELGNAVFRATMPYQRFIYLTECVSMAENSKNFDNIMKFWQKFSINCRSHYASSSWATLGEYNLSLETSNKQPYDVHFLGLCDAKTNFMSNILIKKNITSTISEVLQVACDIKSTGRHITLQLPETQLSLSQELYARGLSTSYIITGDTQDMPKNWSPENVKILYADAAKIQANADGAPLLSYGLNEEVNAVKLHALSADAVKNFWKLASIYSTANATSTNLQETRPSLHLLFELLNCASYNAWILMRLSPSAEEPNIEYRDFQRQLGLFLLQQRLQRHLLRSTPMPLTLKLQICEILGHPSEKLLAAASIEAQQSMGVGMINTAKAALPTDVILASRYGDRCKRCKSCSKLKRQTKARTRCQQCLAHRCHSHLIARCFECTGIEENSVASITHELQGNDSKKIAIGGSDSNDEDNIAD